jgi:hypothetical protein
MDLSRLKWPIVIILVVTIGWLIGPGTGWVHNRLLQHEPGADLKADEVNEWGFTKLGGFLMKTVRFVGAKEVLLDVTDRYPDGENYWFNYYRLGRVHEKLDQNPEAVQIYLDLMDADAHSIDERVPEYEVLKLRRDKLIELNELGEIGSY